MDRSFRVGRFTVCSCARGILCKGECGTPLLPFRCIQRRSNLQNGVFLAVRYHIATPDDLDSILRILLQLSAFHIEVLPLSSGKSGAVSGEVR
jgi:hypothetical protein